MKPTKIDAGVLACVAMLVSALTAGCMADTGSPVPEEATTSQSSLVVNQEGWAWVMSNGVIGGSWVWPGSVTATRIATGNTLVTFTGGAIVNPHVEVVAYGTTNTHCKVGEGGGHSWYVFCFDGAGLWADSAFAIVMKDFSGTDVSWRGAYLASSATGIVTKSWNSTGGMNTVVWNGGVDQDYTVTMPGMPTSNASVHVTAGGAIFHRCKVRSWGTGQVRVKCFDASSNPVQLQFYISYDEFSEFAGHIGGHSWVTGGSPSPFYSQALSSISCFAPGTFTTAPSGLDLIVTLPDPYFPPTAWWDFVPMVTGYGNNASYCKVVNWSAGGSAYNATVRCFDAFGTQINASSAQFTLTFTNNGFPGPC